MALYHPEHGFYSRGGRAGRSGDFVTSPEISPLFGAVVARALDAWWGDLGRPDPFVVVEAAAGAGTLARDVLAARPDCSAALRYLLVERSPVLRLTQARLLPLEPSATVLGPAVAAAGDEDHGLSAVPGRGPLVASLEELPSGPLAGVVLANELLDNLAFSLLERREGSWFEVRVGESAGGELVEVLVPAPPEVAAEAERLAPDAPEGGRLPLQRAARQWLRRALEVLERGRVVAVDYVSTTAALASRPWPQWVRTYRGQGPGAGPLADPGAQDITCEVCVDQLALVRPPLSDRSQADFLAAHGLDELVAEARAIWRSRASIGDLAALKARSRVSEAAALVDPEGLGAFRVIEWTVPPGPAARSTGDRR